MRLNVKRLLKIYFFVTYSTSTQINLRYRVLPTQDRTHFNDAWELYLVLLSQILWIAKVYWLYLFESWIIVAANSLWLQLSDSLHFHRRVCIFYWRAFSFYRRNQHFNMGFLSDGYLTVTITSESQTTIFVWGSTKPPEESPKNLFNGSTKPY